MNDQTIEVQKELEVRVKSFNEKLIPLLGEFQLGLGATPFLTEDGRIAARPSLFDDPKKVEPKTAETKPEVFDSEPVNAEKVAETPTPVEEKPAEDNGLNAA